VYQKFRCDDRRGEESGRVVEHFKACLFADIGNMAEVPGDHIVDLVKRSKGDVDRVADVLALENTAFDITFGKYRNFLGQFQLLKRFE